MSDEAEEVAPLSDERLKDIVARLALAIQRAGEDYLGPVETIHDDLIALMKSYKDIKEVSRRTLDLCRRMQHDLEDTTNGKLAALHDAKKTLEALIAAKTRIGELEMKARIGEAEDTSKMRAELEVLKQNITYQRGEADGRQGHPPAEISMIYLLGYAAGTKEREATMPHSTS